MPPILTFLKAEDGDEDVRAPHVVVESEDEPERLLLNTRVQRDDAFQRQQGKSAAHHTRRQTA